MSLVNHKTISSPLQKNDEFDVIAISAGIDDIQALSEGISVLTEWGLRCRKNNVIDRHWGYLAGKDSIRYEELHSKDTAPLKIFARGGWGAARVLELKQPWQNGWLLGFSDVSSILLSRLSAGFDGGIHGPLVTSLSKEPEWSKERLRKLLFGEPLPDLMGEPWSSGIAHGPLVTCNLTVATHLLGSSHMPNLKGAILVLEDIDEEPYRIDRMLTQWRLAGILQKLSGLAFGNFNNCEGLNEDKSKSFELVEILKDRSLDLSIPIIANLPIGHLPGNAAVPMGKEATLNGNKGILSFSLS